MSIKRLISLLLVLLLCSMSVIGFAQEKEQAQLDVYHINNEDGRTFVPFRFISEALGIKVNYIDMRPEGEVAKTAIIDVYPSMKNLIETTKNKQGNKYVFPRMRVVNYDTNTHIMQIMFEDNKPYRESNSQWFDVNIKDRTIFNRETGKTIIEWYEKENKENIQENY